MVMKQQQLAAAAAQAQVQGPQHMLGQPRPPVGHVPPGQLPPTHGQIGAGGLGQNPAAQQMLQHGPHTSTAPTQLPPGGPPVTSSAMVGPGHGPALSEASAVPQSQMNQIPGQLSHPTIAGPTQQQQQQQTPSSQPSGQAPLTSTQSPAASDEKKEEKEDRKPSQQELQAQANTQSAQQAVAGGKATGVQNLLSESNKQSGAGDHPMENKTEIKQEITDPLPPTSAAQSETGSDKPTLSEQQQQQQQQQQQPGAEEKKPPGMLSDNSDSILTDADLEKARPDLLQQGGTEPPTRMMPGGPVPRPIFPGGVGPNSMTPGGTPTPMTPTGHMGDQPPR